MHSVRNKKVLSAIGDMSTDAEFNMCVKECLAESPIVRMEPVGDVTSRYEEVKRRVSIQRILSETIKLVLGFANKSRGVMA